MTGLVQDVRHALRALLRSPGYTFVAGLTLALGIGANTALFSVVHAVLLQPLPLREPERLYVASETFGERRGGVTGPDFADWVSQGRALTFAAQTVTSATLTGVGEPERITIGRVTADYFTTLGVPPLLGRAFRPEEEPLEDAGVVILAHGYWQRRFGGDVSVVGRTVVVNDVARVVVGVMPPAAGALENGEDAWVPLGLSENERTATGSRFLDVIARLAPGVTLAQAEQEMRAIATRIGEARPHSNRDVGVALVAVHEAVTGRSRDSLFLLFGAVGLVLLIACVNVATLALTRAAGRTREVAIRATLGAAPWRLARQALTESLLLSLAGGAVGLLMAQWGTDLLVAVLPAGTPRLDQVRLSGTVLAFTAALGVLTGAVFGLAPAVRASREDLLAAGTDSARGSSGPARQRVRASLVVAQLALALMLLASAGLLLRSFVAARGVDPGFDPDGLTALRLALPVARYGEPAQTVAFYDRLLERTAALPGVRRAGLTSNIPLGGQGFTLAFTVDGRPQPPVTETPMLFLRVVSADYLPTLGVRLLRGRGLEPGDRTGSARVGVINATAARLHFGGADPVGVRIRLDDDAEVPLEIVGVVADVRGFGLTADPQPELFVPVAQATAGHWRWMNRTMSIVVRAAGDPEALAPAMRQTVSSLDRGLPVYSVATSASLVARSIAPRRLLFLLIGAFAAVAVTLAAIGVYGVIAVAVGQRTREIGIRLALGATPRAVRGLVIRGGVRLLAGGVALGTAGAVMATRALRGQLFGVAPVDPVTFGGVVLVLTTVGLLAAYLPARRATRIDPMVALRVE